jgi:glycosyltransferase involved in cell wall biosynthesis
MKIAFVSYEYPPDTAFGGIATYTLQIAHLMRQRGHQVEVFAGSPLRSGTFTDGDILVHRVQCKNRAEFVTEIAPSFAARHQAIQFDLVESPEIGAESRVISAQHPHLPLVVKLHTPSYLIQRVNYVPPTVGMQARRIIGAIRRGQRPTLLAKQPYAPEQDPERSQTLRADLITTPSNALGEELVRTWHLNPDRIQVVPNPYLPAPSLLNIPIETHSRRVTYIGRLEVRKGVLELADAIPRVLQRHPDVRFRFVGAAWPSPQPGLDMQQYLQHRLRPYGERLEFTGAVALEEIPAVLAETDICVFPSRWENFPGVCLEAMAAGRGVVGSQAGGMVEMLEGGRAGHLVKPGQPRELAAAISTLVANPTQRMNLGRLGRERILTQYNLDKIGALQESVYQQVIWEKAELSNA